MRADAAARGHPGFVGDGLDARRLRRGRRRPNEGGSATTYRDSSQRGPVSGVGIEGQDIVAMTDAMMRDLLQVPLLAAAATPPRVINDAAHFRNDRSQRIDRNLIADRLRMGLARAAKGRLAFVGRISTLDSRSRPTTPPARLRNASPKSFST